MELSTRRKRIVKLLEQSNGPITGTELALACQVSRQVIVQDIALLKAQGVHVISTSEGYMIYTVDQSTYKRVVAVSHDRSDIEDELSTIIDLGGEVLDVIVTHPVYGEISANIMLKSRKNLQAFMKKLKDEGFVPLLQLTQGIHYHTIQASDEMILDEIEEALSEKGYLHT
jgi:transcriptional regulator of NAD metabolism